MQPDLHRAGAGKRSTVYVPDEVGTDKDVSVHLTCDRALPGRAPHVLRLPGTGSWDWTGGHCVIGASAPRDDWFFAEGYTGDGFEEWLCIQNPGRSTANVTITYYPEGGEHPSCPRTLHRRQLPLHRLRERRTRARTYPSRAR